MATAKTLRNPKYPLRVKGEVVYIDAVRFCSSIETEESHATRHQHRNVLSSGTVD